MILLFRNALRDLGRNRRRTFFSTLALALGLALLLLMAAFIRGDMDGALDTAIRLQSGHLQVRANTYDQSKTSLKWQDLIENPDLIANQIASLPPVKAASPRLYATGFVATRKYMTGVRIIGIDPLSEANAPYREGLLSGEFLAPEDRSGVLIGRPLAEEIGLGAGDQIQLSANTSDGNVTEQTFTIRGVYSTQTSAFDRSVVFLPLAKAQSMTGTENHASAIFVLLYDKEQTGAVQNALQSSVYKVLTWTEMNELIIQTENLSRGYMTIFYLIVLGITATVIVNTLVMSVFERTREIGILAAIGMRSRRIMAMFLAESTLLAIGGILLGLALGYLATSYFSHFGYYIGDFNNTSGADLLLNDTIYPKLTPGDATSLTALAFIVTLAAGLFPAILAARMEPVDALRAEK